MCILKSVTVGNNRSSWPTTGNSVWVSIRVRVVRAKRPCGEQCLETLVPKRVTDSAATCSFRLRCCMHVVFLFPHVPLLWFLCFLGFYAICIVFGLVLEASSKPVAIAIELFFDLLFVF